MRKIFPCGFARVMPSNQHIQSTLPLSNAAVCVQFICKYLHYFNSFFDIVIAIYQFKSFFPLAFQLNKSPLPFAMTQTIYHTVFLLYSCDLNVFHSLAFNGNIEMSANGVYHSCDACVNQSTVTNAYDNNGMNEVSTCCYHFLNSRYMEISFYYDRLLRRPCSHNALF